MIDDFRLIPRYPNYAINLEQKVINRMTGRFLTPYLDKATGYYYLRIINADHKSVIDGIHRLMALAFHGEPSDESLVVNHKDGVKTHNLPSNLEWCTRGENNLHAFENGLNNCGRMPVLMKNNKTGIITAFWSATEGAKALGWSTPDKIHRRIRSRPGVLFSDGLLFKYDDGSNWPAIKSDPPPEARKIIAKNILNDEMIIFTGYSAGQSLTGVSTMAILKAADAARELPVKGWVFRHYHKFDGVWPEFDDFEKEIISAHVTYQLGCGVIAEKDGNELRFGSARKAGEHFGINHQSIYSMIREHRLVDGWKLQLKSITRSP